jgi:dolichyl-diphosphooligosaccharide--protein glycosyltransferase
LRRAVIVDGGRVLRQQEYANAAQLTVESVIASGTVQAIYLLDEPAFESNLNQMFVLGRFDRARFEEAFNDFPYARAFRVLAKPE